MISTVLGLLGNWKQWAVIVAGVAAAAGGFAIEELRIAHRETTIATLTGDKAALKRDKETCVSSNLNSAAAFEQERATHRATVAALESLLAAARKTPIEKATIHAASQLCTGVPPAGRALADIVRARQSAAPGR